MRTFVYGAPFVTAVRHISISISKKKKFRRGTVSLSIAGSNVKPPPNGFCPAAFPCAPGVTTQLLYHFPVGISSEKTFLTVSPGQTVLY